MYKHKNSSLLSLSSSTGLKGPVLPGDTQPITAIVCQLGTVSFTWQCPDVSGMIWVVNCNKPISVSPVQQHGAQGAAAASRHAASHSNSLSAGHGELHGFFVLLSEDVLMYRG